MGKTTTRREFFTRLTGSGMGTAGVAADWVASAGFGSTAAVTFTGGANDMRGCVTVTCGGSGQGASPTLTWTFPDGAWDEAPTIVTNRANATQPTIPFTVTTTTTAAVFTFRGTASGSEAYTFFYQVMG